MNNTEKLLNIYAPSHHEEILNKLTFIDNISVEIHNHPVIAVCEVNFYLEPKDKISLHMLISNICGVENDVSE